MKNASENRHQHQSGSLLPVSAIKLMAGQNEPQPSRLTSHPNNYPNLSKHASLRREKKHVNTAFKLDNEA